MVMAKLTKKEVLHVASLAKLDLTEKEIEKFLPQISSIIDFVSQLNEVDTKDIEPTSQTTGLMDVLREDVIKPSSIDQDEALSGTEDTYNGFFKVNAILENRTNE